jgi:division protein CdvB (Snf7/Vps24/ESCRT-III family)
MPRPRRERQALEQERAELRKQVAAHKNELAIAGGMNEARRRRLAEQIRQAQKRLAEIEARLGASVRHLR